MTTKFFADDFSGAGDINGTSPDTGFASLTWVGGTTPNDMALSGGYVQAVDTGATALGYADFGDYLSNYSQPTTVHALVRFRTGATIPTASDPNGVSVTINVGGSAFGFSVFASGGSWRVANTADSSQAVFGLEPSKDYGAVLTIQNGQQTVQVGGQSFSSSVAYATPAVGVNGIGITTGPYMKLDDIVAADATEHASLSSTLPMLTVQAYGGGQASASLPMATLQTACGAQAALTLPMLTMQANGAATLDVTLPMLDLDFIATGAISAHANVSLPMLQVQATGSFPVPVGANITLPALQLATRTGARASLALPMFTVTASATVTDLASANITLPMLTLAASATVTATASAAITLPVPTIVARTGAQLAATLPMPTVSASATTGAVASVRATLPMFTVTASGTVGIAARANVTLPALQPGPRASLIAVLPMLQAEFTAHVVVTATYEAYALNLNHRDPSASDELTRYTNFPFLAILRFQDAHYGVAADGVYRMGGTTDYASPAPTQIPWAVKTGTSDFGADTKKTVYTAYFGGKLGPLATVRAYLSGDTDEDGIYDWQTPAQIVARNYRQKLGRGLKARYFAFGIEGDGELELDTLDLALANHHRRI